jgi:hypothetical protein
VSSYGPVATLSIFCADQGLAPEFRPRRRGHSPLLTTPKTSSPALRAGLFLLRNSQSVILGSSDTAKDLLPIYVFPQLLPRPPSRGFCCRRPKKSAPPKRGKGSRDGSRLDSIPPQISKSAISQFVPSDSRLVPAALAGNAGFWMVKLQLPLSDFIKSACCSVPFRPGSSRRAFRSKPISYPQAASGCTRSSTTAFGSSPARTGRECGFTAVPAMISPTAFR